MAFAAIGVVGFLTMLWLVLSTARRLRPESFKLKATVTRWLSLDLEWSGHNPGTSRRHTARDDENR
jgi:hypothetical protein